jgi:hypothetical protein
MKFRKTIYFIWLVATILTGGYGYKARAAATELFSMSLYNDANLAAYYRLEDVTDSEDSGTDYDLTNVNTMTFDAAKFNNGASTDSNNRTGAQHLKVASDLGITSSSYSMSAWVKVILLPVTTVNEGLETVAIRSNSASDTWDGFFIKIVGTTYGVKYRHFRNGIATYDLDYDFNYGTTNFFHFVTTYDGSTMRLYINGSEVGTPQSISGNGNDGGQYCLIVATYINSNCTGYPGYASTITIDDLSVWSDVLTSDEVASLYNGESAPAAYVQPLIQSMIYDE